MPILKRNGKNYHIPFEANNIAQLLYEGHEIAPDEGTDKMTMKIQSDLVNPILQKLWGDQQQFKTVPGQLENREIPGNPFEFQKVMPNPLNNYNTPLIDPNDLMQRKLYPNDPKFRESLQVKNNYQPTGLMGSPFDLPDETKV